MDRDPTSLFAFRYSRVLPSFPFFANRFAYREKKGKEKRLFPLVNKSFKKKKSYCNVHLVNIENEAFDLNRQRIDH